jgi:hypothetical protein
MTMVETMHVATSGPEVADLRPLDAPAQAKQKKHEEHEKHEEGEFESNTQAGEVLHGGEEGDEKWTLDALANVASCQAPLPLIASMKQYSMECEEDAEDEQLVDSAALDLAGLRRRDLDRLSRLIKKRLQNLAATHHLQSPAIITGEHDAAYDEDYDRSHQHPDLHLENSNNAGERRRRDLVRTAFRDLAVRIAALQRDLLPPTTESSPALTDDGDALLRRRSSSITTTSTLDSAGTVNMQDAFIHSPIPSSTSSSVEEATHLSRMQTLHRGAEALRYLHAHNATVHEEVRLLRQIKLQFLQRLSHLQQQQPPAQGPTDEEPGHQMVPTSQEAQL